MKFYQIPRLATLHYSRAWRSCHQNNAVSTVPI